MEETTVKFRTPKVRKCGLRRANHDEDEEDEYRNRLEETKELQKLRQRPRGVSAVALAIGKKITKEEELASDDPFKMKTGGMIDMKVLKDGRVTDSEGMAIGTAFSVETNRRDEDAEMMKYIEDELAKRKGRCKHNDSNSEESQKNSEDSLYEVPEHLRISSSKKSEEMLSNQMLSGIPEVDLGIEAKIRNIEATEDAKLMLLRERLSKKDLPSQFVPTNVAVNFVQHNRFNLEDDGPRAKRWRETKPPAKTAEETAAAEQPRVALPKEDFRKPGRQREDDEKATDDFHFEKFKKQFRRY